MYLKALLFVTFDERRAFVFDNARAANILVRCYYVYFMFLEVNTVVFMYHRITLEDDDEDEDLGVEPAPKRPVLVILDSLKEGLQRGITDILPHTVAQSVYVIVFFLDQLMKPPPGGFSPIKILFVVYSQEPFLHGVGVVAPTG